MAVQRYDFVYVCHVNNELYTTNHSPETYPGRLKGERQGSGETNNYDSRGSLNWALPCSHIGINDEVKWLECSIATPPRLRPRHSR